MNSCYECILEHADGLVLVKPTIYIIEGDHCTINRIEDENRKVDPCDLGCIISDSESLF